MRYRRYYWTALAGLVVALAAQRATAENAWGTIKGQVIWGGDDIPKQMPIQKVNENKDGPDCLKANKGPILDEVYVVNPKNKGLRWVFVWLAPAKPGQKLPIHPRLAGAPLMPAVIDQPCCRYEPHAFGIREGQEIIAKNSASMPHNVNWTGHPAVNPGNNIQVPPGAEFRIKGLVADRIAVQFQCNIHGWMKAWVRVFDHPYFAVTDENGNFEIKDAPAGDFRLLVWHETGFLGGAEGRTGRPIHIDADKVTDVGQLKFEKKK
jgi:hypothetical protein